MIRALSSLLFSVNFILRAADSYARRSSNTKLDNKGLIEILSYLYVFKSHEICKN